MASFNMQKLAKVKEEVDRLQAARQASYFQLKDGETARCRFNCRDDEPLLIKRHYLVRSKNYLKCSGDQCVACYYKERGHKDIGFPGDLAVFNVIDCRWLHKSPSKTRTYDDGKPRMDFVPCKEDASCKGCRLKLEKVRAGQKFWEMALTHASALDACNKSLSRKCKSCNGVGKIKVASYKCPECEEEMDFVPQEADAVEPEVVRCGSCKASVTPTEVLECSKNCGAPERSGILDTDIEISRKGADKTTAYSFSPVVPFVPTEEWMEKLKPSDLALVCAPLPLEKQALALKLINPWRKGGADPEDVSGVEEYEEGEEEALTGEAEDIFEEKPAVKARSVAAPVRKAAPVIAPKREAAAPLREVKATSKVVLKKAPLRMPPTKPVNAVKAGWQRVKV